MLETTVEIPQAKEEPDIEAAYALESGVKCPSCSTVLQELHVVRLLRTKVNFTSNLPRRGFVIICPECEVLVGANIGSRMV